MTTVSHPPPLPKCTRCSNTLAIVPSTPLQHTHGARIHVHARVTHIFDDGGGHRSTHMKWDPWTPRAASCTFTIRPLGLHSGGATSVRPNEGTSFNTLLWGCWRTSKDGIIEPCLRTSASALAFRTTSELEPPASEAAPNLQLGRRQQRKEGRWQPLGLRADWCERRAYTYYAEGSWAGPRGSYRRCPRRATAC